MLFGDVAASLCPRGPGSWRPLEHEGLPPRLRLATVAGRDPRRCRPWPAVADVHAGLAAGCGRDRRRGDRRGDWRLLRVRPAAARRAVPHTTARGWVRRFRRRAPELGAGFAALAVELGADAPPRACLAVTAAAEDDWGEAELEPGPGVAGPGLSWSMVPVPGDFTVGWGLDCWVAGLPARSGRPGRWPGPGPVAAVWRGCWLHGF